MRFFPFCTVGSVCHRDRSEQGFLLCGERPRVELEVVLVAEPGQIIPCIPASLRAALEMM